MTSIYLILTTTRGDHLGDLPLADVVIAGAGEAGSQERPQLAGDMLALEEQIRAAVDAEGLTVVLDPVDLRIAVSRALMSGGEGSIRIPIVVHDVSGDRNDVAVLRHDVGDDGRDAADEDRRRGGAADELALLDDLFTLDGEEASHDQPR